MTSISFSDSRLVIIAATSPTAPALREQRDELLKHAGELNERDMVVLVALPDGVIETVHGEAPTDLGEIRRLARSEPRGSSGFTVLLVGKDGGVKLRSDKPVRAQELFALIDTMPMRRQEMRR